jgi:hypothetical protein
MKLRRAAAAVDVVALLLIVLGFVRQRRLAPEVAGRAIGQFGVAPESRYAFGRAASFDNDKAEVLGGIDHVRL